MKATGLTSFMARVDAAEYGLCCRLNRGARRPLQRRVFQIASRLGDGILWYALILALPVMYGAAAMKPFKPVAFMWPLPPVGMAHEWTPTASPGPASLA